MYFHKIMYIRCPSCRMCVEIDSQYNYCPICGGVIESFQNNDVKQRNG